MSEAAIVVEDLWKRFRRGAEGSLRDTIPALVKRILRPRREGELREREFWALRDVSFQVKRGEPLGIIGPNGAGKSTILKVLSGILRPNRGTVEVRGRVSALIELAAGFHPDLTGRENVYLNAGILGMSRKEIDRKYDAIVEFAGIEEFMDTPVKRYSSGMFARLGFAVAAHVEPDVLLVDEVLSVGDIAFQSRCLRKMEEFLREKTAVVFVSHNLRSVARLCPRTLLLAGGRPLFLGDTGEAVRRYFEAYSQQKRDTAGGSGEAVIADARLLDRSGAPCGAFAPGSRARFHFTVRFRKDARDVSFGCTLRSQDQTVVMDTNSYRLGHDGFDVRRGTDFHVAFHLTLNLAPGTYMVDANVYDFVRRRVLDIQDGVATFVVHADERATGSAYMDPACEVEVLQAGST